MKYLTDYLLTYNEQLNNFVDKHISVEDYGSAFKSKYTKFT